jgi:hypothetical protein
MNGASGHRAAIAEAVEALEVHADGRYSWFGRATGFGEADLDGAATRALAAYEIELRLYLDFYTRGRATPAPERQITPADLGRRDMVDRYREANGGRGTVEPGWRVLSAGEGTIDVRRGGLRLRVSRDDVVAVDDLTAGAAVGVRMPNALVNRSPGHYMALGDAPFDQDTDAIRLYWNTTPDGAVQAMSALTRDLNQIGVPFILKALDDSSTFTRCDACVLYTPRAVSGDVIAIASRAAAMLGDELKPAVPALTHRIAPGLGYAEDPASGESFGRHRCALIAGGIVDAWLGGSTGLESRMDAVVGRFAQDGLCIDLPFLADRLSIETWEGRP